MVHYCCAYGCTESFVKGSGLGFYRLPHQKSRLISWLLAIRRKDFEPNSNSRICGKHFITGKPSKDINHPDYVPSVFSDQNEKPKKNKKKRKKLCEKEELPIINAQDESNSFLDESGHSDCDEFVSIISESPVMQPEEQSLVENSLLINAETVRKILENDAANEESNDIEEPLSSEQSFNPRAFTFINVNGETIARFVEKRVRTNDLRPKQPSSSYLNETVRIIVDKKEARTIAVDRRSICISSTPELCCKTEAKRTCMVDVSANSKLSNEPETVSIKSEPESDLESKQSGEDFSNFFLQMKDSDLQKNCFGVKIQDLCEDFNIVQEC